MFGVVSVITPVMMILKQGDTVMRMDAQQRSIMRNMFITGVCIVFVSMGVYLMS